MRGIEIISGYTFLVGRSGTFISHPVPISSCENPRSAWPKCWTGRISGPSGKT